MREHLLLTENRDCCCAEAVAEIIRTMSNARRNFLISGGLLAADIAGAALTISSLLSHGRGVTLGTAGLLVPVIGGWLITALFMVLAEQPVAGSISEVRWVTGAPVDLSAPWQPLGARPIAESEIGWEHVVPLIGAAARHYVRSRAALLWAIGTSAGFLLWAGLALGIATVA